MLKDLDQRTASPENQNPSKNILTEIKSPTFIHKNSIINAKFILLLLIITILIIFFIYIFSKKNTVTQLSSSTAVATKKIAAPTNTSATKIIPNEEITLNNYNLDSGHDVGYLRLTLSKAAHYFIANNNSNQPILLTLANTKIISNINHTIPELTPNNWIRSLKFEQLNGALIVEIIPMPDIELTKTDLKNEPEPQLLIQFSKKKNNNTSLENGVMKKTILPPTTEETTQKQYQQAIELILNNKITEAITKLQKLLTADPAYIPAREALVTLLIKTNNNSKALKVLSSGLAKDPENLLFIKLQAQILTDEKKLDAALKILKQHTPPIDREPDYYGFLASLYQRTGQYELAIKIYDQLAKLQPYNSMWWVGLGTSLEAIGESNTATEAYKNALRSKAELSPEVRAYLESKIN